MPQGRASPPPNSSSRDRGGLGSQAPESGTDNRFPAVISSPTSLSLLRTGFARDPHVQFPCLGYGQQLTLSLRMVRLQTFAGIIVLASLFACSEPDPAPSPPKEVQAVTSTTLTGTAGSPVAGGVTVRVIDHADK